MLKQHPAVGMKNQNRIDPHNEVLPKKLDGGGR
jgi:hypothetical protein